MSNEAFLETLFQMHLADLKDTFVGIGDLFVCPICLAEFTSKDIHNKKLTDGHVWPEYIREKSRSTLATQQRVLLCAECNNKAGSHGDKQMQLREAIKDAEKEGQIYGERRVQVILTPGKEPINLRATSRIQKGDTIKGQITFAVDKRTGLWARNNPKEQERFLSIEQGKTFSVLIHSHHEIKANLPKAGWLTSAYLLAFYTFGYRYILHESLDPVREYILSSFKDIPDEELKLPQSKDIGLHECSEHFYNNPEIGVVIPVDGKSFVHLQVSFLDYHIRLPFHFVPHVLQALMSGVPEVYNKLPEIAGSEGYLYTPVMCNKTDGHECKWDYVLGKPILV
jgi:hypothetical protein